VDELIKAMERPISNDHSELDLALQDSTNNLQAFILEKLLR